MPKRVPIGTIRETIAAARWLRNDLTGGTAEEFRRQKVGPRLAEKVEELLALDIAERFAADRERRDEEVQRLRSVIARWDAATVEQARAEIDATLAHAVGASKPTTFALNMLGRNPGPRIVQTGGGGQSYRIYTGFGSIEVTSSDGTLPDARDTDLVISAYCRYGLPEIEQLECHADELEATVEHLRGAARLGVVLRLNRELARVRCAALEPGAIDCLFNPARREECAGMLDDLIARVGISEAVADSVRSSLGLDLTKTGQPS